MQLQVSVGTLDAIKKQYSDPSDCLMETLKTWLKTFSSPSWSNIVDSLRSSVVGEVRLADDLKHKHCSTQNTSSAATRPVPPTPVSAQPTTPQHLSPSPTVVTQYSVPPPILSAFSDHPTPQHLSPSPTVVTQYSVLPPILSAFSDHPTPLPVVPATMPPATVTTHPLNSGQENTGMN